MMERSGGDRRYPSWQWLAGILILVLFATVGALSAIASYAYKDTQKKIELKADKEDMDEMKKDIREIRAMVESHVVATGAGTVHRK